ncbi:MAG: SDR family oxidoreductase [Spirochaetota bacterium]
MLRSSLQKSLVKEGGGKIIFLGALSGLDHFGSREVVNTATKFGLIGVTQALHAELQKYKISCTVINPGNIETRNPGSEA